MCLDRGKKPTLQEFEEKVHARNYDHLCIWQSVGMDVENGWWAIYGARLGTYFTMLREWDYTQVQDFDYLATLWNSFGKDEEPSCKHIGATLRTRLGLPIVDMSEEQSKFFKYHYAKAEKNLGTEVTEMQVIRKVEGW